jgi:phosphohistidine phosphatase
MSSRMSSRTLVVMRHAKAEPSAPSDVERPLAERGHHDAAAAGAWLAGRDVVPDHALVSAARRTRETWEHTCRGAGETWAATTVSFDEGLYAAGVDTALDLLGLVDDAHRCVLLVGHNPTVAQLAQLLDDGEGDPAATDELARGDYPTSATTVFAVPGSWSDLAPGTARLIAHHVGRG